MSGWFAIQFIETGNWHPAHCLNFFGVPLFVQRFREFDGPYTNLRLCEQICDNLNKKESP